MWFWFVYPKSLEMGIAVHPANSTTQVPAQLEPDVPQQSQPEAIVVESEPHSERNVVRDSQPQLETNIPQQSQPEKSKKRQPKSVKNTPRQPQQRRQAIPTPELLVVLKPEILCIGFVGLIHDGCLFFVLAYYFGYWAFALNHVIKENISKPTKDHYYEYGRVKITIIHAVCFMVLHLIGSVLTPFIIRMDHFLRYSTDPVI